MLDNDFAASSASYKQLQGPLRWITAHLLNDKRFIFSYVLCTILANILNITIPMLIGRAYTIITQKQATAAQLLAVVLPLLGIALLGGICDICGRLSAEVLSKRLATRARDELYLNLLGKSQAFHSRHAIGDVMARATYDIGRLSDMIIPGLDTIFNSFACLIIALIFIGQLDPALLLSPLLFTALFLFTLWHYTRRLGPIYHRMREEFGQMNAVLAETLTGIAVVKGTAQEQQEERRFQLHAQQYRDDLMRAGTVQARYLPTLLLACALVGAFLHGAFLVMHAQLSIGSLVAYMGLMIALRFPTSISLWSFSLVQQGIAGAARILTLLKDEDRSPDDAGGYADTLRGEIVFEQVACTYDGRPALKNISFRVEPGQTVAIVGQTGSGKSTLTKLVNRLYEPDAGRVLIDGVEVSCWNLDALRSQISTIEQDVFLFARTIAENISYGLEEPVDQARIEQAARDAQAHRFISQLPDGYTTVLGERGMTLSGGERQRIAIARALLTDPRILILDDSTSAIDSATEDEIQKAMRRISRGRTTLLITSRLSQICWADKILVLRKGELLDQGTHAELLARCELYRRIFIPDEPDLSATRREQHGPLPPAEEPGRV